MMYKTTFSVLGLVISCWACNLTSLGDPEVVADVETEFVLDLQQHLSGSDRLLQFELETLKAQDCKNTLIQNELSVNEAGIVLEINEVGPPEFCESGYAPATALVTVGTLNEGLYNLEINLGKTVFNTGVIEVQPDRYVVTLNTENGIDFQHHRMYRIPEHLLWGYIIADDIEDAAISELTSAFSEFGTIPVLKEGYYGHFIFSSGKISTTRAPKGERVINFIFQTQTEKEAFYQLADEFRSKQGKEESLRLFFSDGEVY